MNGGERVGAGAKGGETEWVCLWEVIVPKLNVMMKLLQIWMRNKKCSCFKSMNYCHKTESQHQIGDQTSHVGMCNKWWFWNITSKSLSQMCTKCLLWSLVYSAGNECTFFPQLYTMKTPLTLTHSRFTFKRNERMTRKTQLMYIVVIVTRG